MKNMRHIIFAAGLTGLLLPASGCLSGGSRAQRQAQTQKRTYMPMVETAKPLAESPLFAAAKLRAVRVSEPFDARTFIVRRGNTEFTADYYHSWLRAPQDLIRAQTARYLQSANLFTAVHDTGSGTSAPLGIEGIVDELYLDYTDPQQPAAVVTMRLLVTDERSPTFTPLFSARQSIRAPLPPSAPADALTDALTRVLAALTLDLSNATLPAP